MSSRHLSIIFSLVLLAAIFLTGGRKPGAELVMPQAEGPEQRGTRSISLSPLLPSFLAPSPVEEPYPKRKQGIPEPELTARAAIIISEDGSRVFFAKNPDEKVLIASLAKLMTAWVATKTLPFDKEITISRNAVLTEGENGRLIAGETLRFIDLLKVMILESSNDAAQAIAEVVGEEGLVDKMNQEAKALGLTNTHFSNPMGFDDPHQYSSARDVARLTAIVADDLNLGSTLAIRRSTVFSTDGLFKHELKNSNDLLGIIPEIVGGKTGYTEGAGGCLGEVLEMPKMRVVAVVLGSEDRFNEMQKLIQWLKAAYGWNTDT